MIWLCLSWTWKSIPKIINLCKFYNLFLTCPYCGLCHILQILICTWNRICNGSGFLFFILQLSRNHNPKSICIFKHTEKCLFELCMIYKVSLFLYAVCITFLSLILMWMPFFETVSIILEFYLYNFSACQEFGVFFLFVMCQSLPESINPLSETSSNLLSSM